MAEDLTQSEQLRRLEVEAANLRLVRTMADRLTHEIGNAMVPLSTHQQLLADKCKDPEFRASLDVALADGVKRVTRLINQMRFLARDACVSQEAFPLAPLIEEAYRGSPQTSARQSRRSSNAKTKQQADRRYRRPRRAETCADRSDAQRPAGESRPTRKSACACTRNPTATALHGLQIEVQDNGTGFTPEAAQKAPSPFFTTRNVGLGLGLTVSRKIIETHHGKLEILPPQSGQSGMVRISLPVDAPAAGS